MHLKMRVWLEPAATPYWKERQLRLCRDLGIRIHAHRGPTVMEAFVNQEGQRAMVLHGEVLSFDVMEDQIKGND